MNKIIFFTIILFASISVYAFDLDLTVDDEIRKNYNSSKLIQDAGTTEDNTLPDLPEIVKKEPAKHSSETSHKTDTAFSYQQINVVPNIKIPRGTILEVYNTAQISDWQAKGTKIKFKTKNIISKKKFSIPSETIFNGEIIEVHQPQITCNGGLVVIRIHSMNYKGHATPVNGYIVKANGEKIFLNNIKGERTYLQTMWEKGNWGRVIFSKMLALTINLGSEGSTLLLSPFPFMYGSICLGMNTLSSPICAFFSKGKHVSIPAGSSFKIKFLEDTYIKTNKKA